MRAVVVCACDQTGIDAKAARFVREVMIAAVGTLARAFLSPQAAPFQEPKSFANAQRN